MKKITFILLIAFVTLGSIGVYVNASENSLANNDNVEVKETRIQVAILLDTSSSMDGLIEQAKSRLWNIVNTLTTLKYKGKTPQIEIAIYEYGNDGIRSNDWVRRVTPLTNDLDLISEKLFALTTNGGLEYCGTVIDKAVKDLEWGSDEADMKLIYIAGNEPFTQGRISYKDAIVRALKKNIYINTIHCGYAQEGIEGKWKDGAMIGKGKFFNIDQDVRVRHYDTPYDDRISSCNSKLNDTYISYGRQGSAKKQNQMAQDTNARSISTANYAERVVSKSKEIYNNSSWDLVDKFTEDAAVLDEIKPADLPTELKNKSKKELKELVSSKKKERIALQSEISDLAKKRQAYIEEQMKKDSENTGDDLGKAINQSVLDLAMTLGYQQAE